MSRLLSGEMYSSDWGEVLIAGSRAEGLALKDHWGHPPADWDRMWLRGDQLRVYVPQGPQPRNDACLVYHPEGCPSSYCCLEVIDVRGVRQAISGNRHSCWERRVNVFKVPRCIHRANGQYWLNTYHTVRLMEGSSTAVRGPAGQSGLDDWVMTLVCSAPNHAMEWGYRHRPGRYWPPTALTEHILQLPMLLVLVGHKYSPNFRCQARMSCSHFEMKLVQELPDGVRQGYIACKYVLKRFLEIHRGQTKTGDGRSRVGSYHIKTAFLHYLEKRPPQLITSPFGLLVDLLHDLDRYLEVGKLPHYFLPECNLLETVDGEERRIVRQAIRAILSNPLAALLTSPTCSRQVYGKVRPDFLVNRFRCIFTYPKCKHSHINLSNLLAYLDAIRKQRHRKHKSSGRPEPTLLVDTLKRETHHITYWFLSFHSTKYYVKYLATP